MKHSVAEALLQAAKGRPVMVRIHPNNGGASQGRGRHYQRGRLMAIINGTKASVKPAGHGRADTIELSDLKVWKAQLPTDMRHLVRDEDAVETTTERAVEAATPKPFSIHADNCASNLTLGAGCTCGAVPRKVADPEPSSNGHAKVGDEPPRPFGPTFPPPPPMAMPEKVKPAKGGSRNVYVVDTGTRSVWGGNGRLWVVELEDAKRYRSSDAARLLKLLPRSASGRGRNIVMMHRAKLEDFLTAPDAPPPPLSDKAASLRAEMREKWNGAEVKIALPPAPEPKPLSLADAMRAVHEATNEVKAAEEKLDRAIAAMNRIHEARKKI